MSGLYNHFKADENIEKTGIVVQYGENSKGKPMEVRIARAGGSNVRYSKVLEHKIKPYRRQLQNETLDSNIQDRILREVYAETVILGWENMEDKENNDLSFSRENVLFLLADLPDWFKDVQEQANKFALFRLEDLKEDAKN